MAERVLITGGAGFIGAHAAAELLARGHEVRALDSLEAQVHGEDAHRPAYLDASVELARGDVRDPAAVRRALEGCGAVVHLAAAVGVGQSMYEIARYTAINDVGTAVLLEALAERPPRRLVAASSMSVYGEGLARDPDGRPVEPARRGARALARGRFELEDAAGRPLEPLPTPESKTPDLASVYALNKHVQERMCLIWGEAYGVPVTALRFFNVYGEHQALSNPYTGVLAIFAARLLNNKPPLVFEDGLQRRDFVHAGDVARAVAAAVEAPEGGPADGAVLNVGSGTARTVLDVARALAAATGKEGIEPEVTLAARAGDVRHCFADVAAAKAALGWAPRQDFAQGLADLASWLAGQEAFDRVEQAGDELTRRGLLRKSALAGAVA